MAASAVGATAIAKVRGRVGENRLDEAALVAMAAYASAHTVRKAGDTLVIDYSS
jgi:hypothetical protein